MLSFLPRSFSLVGSCAGPSTWSTLTLNQYGVISLYCLCVQFEGPGTQFLGQPKGTASTLYGSLVFIFAF